MDISFTMYGGRLMKTNCKMLSRSVAVAVALFGMGLASAHATVIIDETWPDSVGTAPDANSWGATSGITQDGAGNVVLDTSSTPQQLLGTFSGPYTQGYLPAANEFARLTINDMVPDYNSYFGLEGYGTRIIIRSDLATGAMHVDINDNSTFTHRQTTLTRWANGQWVIDWYTDRVTISNNGSQFFDSDVDLPTTGDLTWSVPTGEMRPSFYFSGAAQSAGLGQITWEHLPVPEPAGLSLLALSGLLVFKRR